MINSEDLRNMRAYGKKTTQQMANKVSVTRNTYENWERNVGQPKVIQFLILCIFCGIDTSGFINKIKDLPNLLKKDDKNNDKRIKQ